jgi:DNA-binding MarR family transcriptional regulator
MSAHMKKQKKPEDISVELFINFQKLFRCMDFGRGMRDRSPVLTVRQMQVLSFFNESEEVHISDVSRRLNMSIQSVNNMVKRLEVMGYVERTKNEQDKRLSDIRFTKKGRDGFEMFRAEQLNFIALLLKQLDEPERAAAAQGVERAAALMQKAMLGIAELDEARSKIKHRDAKATERSSIIRTF